MRIKTKATQKDLADRDPSDQPKAPQASKRPLPSYVQKPHVSKERRNVLRPQSVTPHNSAAEQAVLGSMLIEAEAIRVARQILQPQHFYQEAHRIIFKTILDLSDSGAAVDIVLVDDALMQAGKSEAVGGMPYLADLVDAVVTAAHVAYYAKVVAVAALDREIIATCFKYAQEQQQEVLEKLRNLHIEREAIKAPFLYSYPVGMPGIVDQILAEREKQSYNTHFKIVDRHWKGMKAGEVNVWGAATNQGKSVLLLNLMDRAARAGEPCLYIGTEMAAIETIKRHLSIASKVEAWRIRKPELEPQHVSQLKRSVVGTMQKLPISILDDPEPSLTRIEAAITASKAKRVFLDYLERFDMPPAESLRLQIKAFMKRLTTIARRTDTIIELAAQLSRETYGVDERPPVLSDLSESSAIEKEASRVTLFWSPKNIEKFRDKSLDLEEGQRYIQALNRKNRHGATGQVFEFILDEKTLTIKEIEEHEDPFNKPL